MDKCATCRATLPKGVIGTSCSQICKAAQARDLMEKLSLEKKRERWERKVNKSLG